MEPPGKNERAKSCAGGHRVGKLAVVHQATAAEKVWPELFTNALAPLLDPCLHTKISSRGNTAGIPLGQKFPYANNALPNHRGDS